MTFPLGSLRALADFDCSPSWFHLTSSPGDTVLLSPSLCDHREAEANTPSPTSCVGDRKGRTGPFFPRRLSP